MEIKSLRSVDYLEYLTGEEEWLVFCLEEPMISPAERDEVERELQLVREIKDIVKLWGAK